MNKNLKIKRLVLVAAIVIVGGALFMLGQRQDNPNANRVGAIIPLTGEVATYGDSLKRGFDLAADEFGGKVQVMYEDSKASPKDGASAMQKFLSQGVHHYLGDATSGVCLAIAPIANENKALLMISIATSDDLSKAGPYVFRNCPPNQQQSEAAAKFMKENLKAHKVAILAKANPYAVNLAAKFREQAAAQGLNLVLDEQYDASVKDFSMLIEKVRGSAPDAVFVPGNYEETALILRKAKELGIAVPFVGTDGAYSPKLVELAGAAAEGFYITMLGVETSSPFYQNFLDKYRSRYHAEPDVFSAYGYEGAMVLFQAIREGGNIDEQRQRLASGKFSGLMGEVTFDVNGQVVRPVGIMRVTGGRFLP